MEIEAKVVARTMKMEFISDSSWHSSVHSVTFLELSPVCEEQTVLISASWSLKCRKEYKTSDSNDMMRNGQNKSFQISLNITQL